MSRNHKLRIVLPEVERQKIVKIANQRLLRKQKDCEKAINYLLSQKRGFSEEQFEQLIKNYQLGYMNESVVNQYGDPHEFSGRLVIPIKDQYGELVALSSRDLHQKSFMKFFHESFNKSIYLYGLDIAKEEIIKKNKVIIVEGQFDCIYLQMNGFKNTIGILGSAFHIQQLSLIRRYCDQIYFLLDGDKSGKRAASKAIKQYKHNAKICGLEMFIVDLGSDLDPDEYLRRYGRDQLVKLLNKTKEDDDKII